MEEPIYETLKRISDVLRFFKLYKASDRLFNLAMVLQEYLIKDGDDLKLLLKGK